jgi:hypothetical protein
MDIEVEDFNKQKTMSFKGNSNNLAVNEVLNFLHEKKLTKKFYDKKKINDLPIEWDWRSKGAVSKVKDQGIFIIFLNLFFFKF